MENAQLKWNKILNTLEKTINDQSFRTWFYDTKVIDKTEENNLIVSVPTRFAADYLNKNYVGYISELSQGLFTDKLAVKFISGTPKFMNNVETEQVALSPNEQQAASTTALNPKYNFEQYIVGKSNNFAHSAAIAVAECPGSIYNPLFIYGESGMGKTHLMQAIGRFILDGKRNRKIVHYITAEEFTNQMIDSLRSNSMPAFRHKYRNIDVLLIDDIHFLAKKEGIQEEFFHTFNTLYENKRQIVMTSDRPPKDIEDLEKRLVTRFECGLMADLKTPDFETRMAILKKKVEAEDTYLAQETLEFVCENISSNVRALEGSLIRILAYCSYNNINPEDVDRELCQEILSDMISDKVAEINMTRIMNKVCDHFGLTPGQILSNTRKKNIVFPRQVAMYLSNLLIPQLTLKNIAQYYQRKDHTTVLHAKKHIENLFRSDNDFRIQVEKIISDIKQKD
ncbi:MAG: chromosomal replication initiator protein DnaA [Candidatus Cloacimonas sp.]|nr:chromosomal replication initiator protein DnaA [Candidatus Cloacimonadota bacterium]